MRLFCTYALSLVGVIVLSGCTHIQPAEEASSTWYDCGKAGTYEARLTDQKAWISPAKQQQWIEMKRARSISGRLYAEGKHNNFLYRPHQARLQLEGNQPAYCRETVAPIGTTAQAIPDQPVIWEARGQSPAWQLNMHSDGSLTLKTGQQLRHFSGWRPLEQGMLVKRFELIGEQAPILTQEHVGCMDPVSGQRWPLRVLLEHNGQEWVGCGRNKPQ